MAWFCQTCNCMFCDGQDCYCEKPVTQGIEELRNEVREIRGMLEEMRKPKEPFGWYWDHYGYPQRIILKGE